MDHIHLFLDLLFHQLAWQMGVIYPSVLHNGHRIPIWDDLHDFYPPSDVYLVASFFFIVDTYHIKAFLVAAWVNARLGIDGPMINLPYFSNSHNTPSEMSSLSNKCSEIVIASFVLHIAHFKPCSCIYAWPTISWRHAWSFRVNSALCHQGSVALTSFTLFIMSLYDIIMYAQHEFSSWNTYVNA